MRHLSTYRRQHSEATEETAKQTEEEEEKEEDTNGLIQKHRKLVK